MRQPELTYQTSTRPRPSIGACVCTGLYSALFVGLYYSAYEWMISDWMHASQRHCFLAPFIVAYLIWTKRKLLATIPSVPSWLGVVPLLFGVLLYWLGELGGEFYSLYVSSWLVLCGLILMHLGWRKLREIGFAFVFLLAMFPLPNFVVSNVSLRLQLISSEIGAFLMRCYGLTAFREGSSIDLGFAQIKVMEGFNGLRYIFAFIMLGLLLSHLSRASLWKKIALFVSAVPAAVLMNGILIASMGISLSMREAQAAHAFLRDYSGSLVFMTSLGILLGEMAILGRGVSVLPPTEGSAAAEFVDSSPEDIAPQKRFGLLLPALFSVAILGSTLAYSSLVDFRGSTPLNKPFSEFPRQIDKWVGTPQRLDQETIDTLDLSDYLLMDYRSPDGKSVSLYAAYYESQGKGESIHTPATCLPGRGWVFEEEQVIELPLAGHPRGSIQVSRTFMRKASSRFLAYYWFPQRGRVLTNLYQLKLYAFWDSFTLHRTDGALVRVITPVYDSDAPGQAEKRLREFCSLTIPILDGLIPGRDIPQTR